MLEHSFVLEMIFHATMLFSAKCYTQVADTTASCLGNMEFDSWPRT